MQKWPKELAQTLQAELNACCSRHSNCKVLLTGGRSANALYKEWSALLRASAPGQAIEFYFGDERCVAADHEDSNFRAAVEALFPSGSMPPGITVHRIHGEAVSAEKEAIEYERRLPMRIDILLLSIGEDGHIASLFPNSPALSEKGKRVVAVSGPQFSRNRITITPRVIAEAERVIVMATSQTKKAIHDEIRLGHTTVNKTPAMLVKNATWIFGDD